MDDGNTVAVKTLRLHVLLQVNYKTRKAGLCIYTRPCIDSHIDIWHPLCHVNIQKLLGIIVFQGGFDMVSAWREEGDLQQYLAKHPDVERYSFVRSTLVSACSI